ncbi:superoxide dismutase [Candidatus Carsonella ruddii CS isolate Thao2000]|uniref:Superoxide dismutase n=1 Tax=Candidatus Carsonella ruddii CS isolate Thao2000 TaxID=1202537 RepID=J7GSN6_CARRU|nr:superoxide dismutase [Candidatus Carsonella ruddii]AFP83767.1 superoxide dismutase [Candidatus Carsonella ruddii CS isolate Thao2000]
MLKIFNLKYKNNKLFSKNQFETHLNIYKKSFEKINYFLFKKKINFNNFFELIDLILDLPESEKYVYSNILGNYLNHHYFFKNITFNKNILFGNIKELIIKSFNNIDNFYFNFLKMFKEINNWGWLIINNNKLSFVSTKENINPLFPITIGGYNSIPLLCIDLHEHCYLLDYNFNKELYIKEFLNYINWFEIENRLQNYIINN